MSFPIIKLGPTGQMHRVYPQPLYDSVTLAAGTNVLSARFFYTSQGESDPFSGEIKTTRETNLKKARSIEQIGTLFIAKMLNVYVFTKLQNDADLLIESGSFRFFLNGTDGISLPLWKLRHGYELKPLGKMNALRLETLDQFYVEVEWLGGIWMADSTRISICLDGSMLRNA